MLQFILMDRWSKPIQALSCMRSWTSLPRFSEHLIYYSPSKVEFSFAVANGKISLRSSHVFMQ